MLKTLETLTREMGDRSAAETIHHGSRISAQPLMSIHTNLGYWVGLRYRCLDCHMEKGIHKC